MCTNLGSSNSVNTTKEVFSGKAVVYKEDGKPGNDVNEQYGTYNDDGKKSAEFLFFNKWQKNGKERIYINDYKNRTIGYIENGEYHEQDKQGNNAKDIERAIDRFKKKYKF